MIYIIGKIKGAISTNKQYFTKPSLFEIISEFLTNTAFKYKLIRDKSLSRIDVGNIINKNESTDNFYNKR